MTTPSQRRTITTYCAQQGVTVKTTHQPPHTSRLAVVFTTDASEPMTAFTYSLYIGTRGGIYETEQGTW